MKKVQGILLAAGNSSRLGFPKHLVDFQGISLLENSIQAIHPFMEEIHIILGEYHSEINTLVNYLNEKYSNLNFHTNKKWEEGMGTSLSFGLNKIQSNKPVLIHLVDLPFVNRSHVEILMNSFEENSEKFIVSKHHGQSAPPCIIPESQISSFYNWSGREGLNKFFKTNPDLCIFVELGIDFVDIDLPEDLDYLNNTIE